MKIKPQIKKRHKTVDYTDLKVGDVYLYNGDLYIKVGFGDQIGFCLNDGGHMDDMCDMQVIPVDTELKWSYRKPEKSKPKTN